MKQIRNVGGKIVGHITDGVFYKKVKKSKHLQRIFNAWGMDTKILGEDFEEVRILDTESGQVYTTTKKKWLEHGFKRDFGYGEQSFLPLKHFELVSKNQPRMIE